MFGARVSMARALNRVALLCGLLALGACSGSAGGVGFGTWTPTITATPEIAALENEMFLRVNRDRKAKGLPPFRYDDALADVARAHSLDMRDHGFFAHESPNTGVLEDRMDRAGYLATEMRENLAQAGDVNRAEDNLLDSPGHHANLMATTVSHIGIGIVKGGAGDARVLTITQVFSLPAQLDTPSAAHAKIVAALAKARKHDGLGPMQVHDMLDELAGKHIDELPDGVPEDAVSSIGKEVSSALNGRRGHGLNGILIAGQGFFTGEEFVIPAAVHDARVSRYGMALAEGKDARGRPRVKVLVLFGQVAP
jgi:uncharacterized protein YkwD